MLLAMTRSPGCSSWADEILVPLTRVPFPAAEIFHDPSTRTLPRNEMVAGKAAIFRERQIVVFRTAERYRAASSSTFSVWPRWVTRNNRRMRKHIHVTGIAANGTNEHANATMRPPAAPKRSRTKI